MLLCSVRTISWHILLLDYHLIHCVPLMRNHQLSIESTRMRGSSSQCSCVEANFVDLSPDRLGVGSYHKWKGC